MEIIYCKKWWFPRKKPIEIFNEETARNNHLSGEDYTYAFHKENDKLFLNAAYYHSYEAEKEIELMVFGFKQSGELYMEKRDLLSGEIEEREKIM